MKEKRDTRLIGLGACVMDTLITLPAYPKEDTKLGAKDSRISGGGPAATGTVAAAALGVPSGFIGVLAEGESGSFLRDDFLRFGVDVTHVRMKPGYRGFTSSIWLAEDKATRTCVFDKGNLPPLILDEGMREAVSRADLLLIDGNELEGAKEACRIARESGTRILYDCGGMYEGVEALLGMTDVMIPSEEFAAGMTGSRDAREAAVRLYETYHPAVVVVTCGARGGVFYDGARISEYPAFPVRAVDTNGSGDVFHGAFAAAILKGMAWEQCCCFASAAAALKCMGLGARESVPREEKVLRFLEERGIRL